MNIYHLVPVNLEGTTLYPLNTLQEKHPALAEYHEQKYKERETLKSVVLPVLNCLWNDVLHFTPIHPTKIMAAFLQYNYKWLPRRWFVFDPESPIFEKSKTLIVHPPIWQHVGYRVSERDYEFYHLNTLQKYLEFPEISHEYFKKCQGTLDRPFLFNYSAHFLYKGAVNIENTEIIEI